jgi:hypothetical protein
LVTLNYRHFLATISQLQKVKVIILKKKSLKVTTSVFQRAVRAYMDRGASVGDVIEVLTGKFGEPQGYQLTRLSVSIVFVYSIAFVIILFS